MGNLNDSGVNLPFQELGLVVRDLRACRINADREDVDSHHWAIWLRIAAFRLASLALI